MSLERVSTSEKRWKSSEQRAKADLNIGCENYKSQILQRRRFWCSDSVAQKISNFVLLYLSIRIDVPANSTIWIFQFTDVEISFGVLAISTRHNNL